MMFFLAVIAAIPALCRSIGFGTNSVFPKCCSTNQSINLNSYACEEMRIASTQPFEPLLDAVSQSGFKLKEVDGGALTHCRSYEVFTNRPLNKENVKMFSSLCVDQTTNGINVIVGCAKPISDRIRIRKCCQFGDSAFPTGCNTTGVTFEVTIRNSMSHEQIMPVIVGDIDIMIPGCSDRYPADNFYLLDNGSLLIKMENFSQVLQTDEFCMENIGFDNKSWGFICFPDDTQDEIEHRIFAAGTIISITFLFATLIIYLLDHKKLNLFSQTLISHICSITVAYMCLAILRIIPKDYKIQFEWCQFLAYLMMFTFLAAFFWLNVMSIDIWRKFRTLRNERIRRGKQIKRFTCYSFYAWGSALVITSITAIFVNFENLPKLYSPVINNSCWLSRDSYGYYIFFILPIAVLIASNCVMFVFTAYRCYQVKSEINKKRDDKMCNDNFLKWKDQLIVSFKLFVVMGVTWSLEVISFLFRKTTPGYIWHLSDAINTFYGLIIFLVFLLKKKKIQEICDSIRGCAKGRRSKSGYSTRFRKVSNFLGPSTTSGSYCYTTEVTDSSERNGID